jgi:hypothetical protein
MSDPYEHLGTSLVSPASGGFAIAPDDESDLQRITRAIYVGGPGALSVVLAWGETVTFENLPGGVLLPIRVSRVLSATTADDLVGLY